MTDRLLITNDLRPPAPPPPPPKCCSKTNLNASKLLIRTFSVLSLQLNKLRCHNKSAIDLSNANPARGHKEVRRSTGHIVVTTRYPDQQVSKLRQNVVRQNNQWHRPMSKRFKSNLDRLELLSPTHGQRSQQQSGQITLQSVLINKPKFLKATHRTEMRKIEITRSMVVEALSWRSEPASSRPKPCASLKKPYETCPFAALLALVGRKQTVVRDQLFPQKPPSSRL